MALPYGQGETLFENFAHSSAHTHLLRLTSQAHLAHLTPDLVSGSHVCNALSPLSRSCLNPSLLSPHLLQ